MKKALIILTILIFSGILLHGQKIEMGQVVMDANNEVMVPYSVSGLTFNQSLNISLYVSKDDDKKWFGPLKEVSGDIGSGIRNGNHTIIWSAMKEMPFTDEVLMFEVQPNLEVETIKREIFVIYVGNDVTYIGGRAGMIGKVGFYGEIRLNPLTFASIDYTFKDGEIIDYDKPGFYEFTQKKGYSAFSILGGATFQTGRNFFIYTGVGYGWEKYLYEITNYSYENNHSTGKSNVVNDEYNLKGFELDAGVIHRFKMILLSAGVTTISFKNIWWTAGVGVCF